MAGTTESEEMLNRACGQGRPWHHCLLSSLHTLDRSPRHRPVALCLKLNKPLSAQMQVQ